MRKFHITVNGQPYEVEVEEVGASAGYAAPAPVAAAPVAAPVAAPAAPAPAAAAPAAAPAAKGTAPAGSEIVKAPMPGTILKINVAAGDSVKKGAVLCILEAMKMENEILCPRDGVVAAIMVTKGENVSSNANLIALN